MIYFHALLANLQNLLLPTDSSSRSHFCENCGLAGSKHAFFFSGWCNNTVFRHVKVETGWKCRFLKFLPNVPCCLARTSAVSIDSSIGSSAAASSYLHILKYNIDQILLNGEINKLHIPDCGKPWPFSTHSVTAWRHSCTASGLTGRM